MAIGETQLRYEQKNGTVAIILLPRGALGQETAGVEHIQVPNSRTFLQLLNQKGVSSDTTGAQIMLIMYEELGIIPKIEDIEAIKYNLTELKKAATEYAIMLEQAQDQPIQKHFYNRLAKKGLDLDSISSESTTAIEDYLVNMLEQRKPIQDQVAMVEKRLQDYLGSSNGKVGEDFGDKIEVLYDATDDLIERDEFLKFAAKMRKDAEGMRNDTLTYVARTFERFIRFMVYDELGFNDKQRTVIAQPEKS